MAEIIPQTTPDFDSTRIIERPDGFYWQDKETSREYGPFPTLLAAVEDMQSIEEDGLAPGESVEEAESEIGIADWTDPESGEPVEEERPRIQDDH